MKLNELLTLFIKNKEHLSYWHHEWEELMFKTVDELLIYIKRNRHSCYALYFLKKMVGFIEIGRLTNFDKNTKYRSLSFWLDQDHSRKGIMYNSLLLIEKILFKQNTGILLAEVETDNIPSINLMKKLGYKINSASWRISMDGETSLHFYTYIKKKASV